MQHVYIYIIYIHKKAWICNFNLNAVRIDIYRIINARSVTEVLYIVVRLNEQMFNSLLDAIIVFAQLVRSSEYTYRPPLLS